ncbi:M4 family metallopeptidase [Clostridium sp. KNHs214]|uniref:M4 family metallopeptidase n=1 Tax=Clostridium sp. KNHs214 TaxID=1540257 RepID=UPI00068D9082|nr:M4 family metallopeptidase [Clostridium sp. KNHs214]
MKKLFVFSLTSVFLLNSVIASAVPAGTDLIKSSDKEAKKVKIIEKFNKKSIKSGKEFKIYLNEANGTPNFIFGDLSENHVNTSEDAENFMTQNKDIFKLETGNFVNESIESDKLGMKHYKNKLVVDGIPVYGSEVILHADDNGNVYAINGNVKSDVTVKNWSKEFKLNAKKAIKTAENSLDLKGKTIEYTANPKAEPYIYNKDGNWIPVYHVTMQFLSPFPGNMKVFVNATNGSIVSSKNLIKTSATTGTGVGLYGTRNLNLDLINNQYYMRDLTKNTRIETYTANYGSYLPGTVVNDTDNKFDSSSQFDAVDVHYNSGAVYDFYKNNFNRNSFDDNGTTIKSTVLYRDPRYPNEPFDNAFWNGSQMVYGDCSGTYFAHIGSALDVVGHEFTHAITDRTANLEYEYQSGALNESFSDVFGYFIEGENNDWLMGEDCYTPNTPGDALRSLADPTLYDQPAHMDNYRNLPNTQQGDWGGVHINSGIPNKAFYLAATSINDNSKLQQIYYRALTLYLTQYSQFIDAKNALVQAATDLYPGTTISQKISDAFAQVGIGQATSDNDTYESNNTLSTAYGPIVSGTSYKSYIYSPTDIDYFYFNTSRTGTITVSLTNLPKDYDVYLLNSSGKVVARSTNGGTSNESIYYNARTTGKFYVKIVGYGGANSQTGAYSLNVNYPR